MAPTENACFFICLSITYFLSYMDISPNDNTCSFIWLFNYHLLELHMYIFPVENASLYPYNIYSASGFVTNIPILCHILPVTESLIDVLIFASRVDRNPAIKLVCPSKIFIHTY